MPTLGTVALDASSRDAAFDALVAACTEAGAKVKHSDTALYTVDGESGTMWLKNRFSFRFFARIVGESSGGNNTGSNRPASGVAAAEAARLRPMVDLATSRRTSMISG